MESIQKQIERFLVKEFLEAIGKSPEGKILMDDRPDSRVPIDGEWIGIEVTCYYQGLSSQGSKPQALKVEWEKIIRDFTNRLEGEGLSHLTGVVSLNAEKIPKRNERESLVSELVQLVKTKTPVIDPNEKLEIQIRDMKSSFSMMSQYLKTVSLWETGPARVPWKCRQTFVRSVGITDNEFLQIIRKKKREVKGYNRNGIDSLWLLIVSTGESPASIATPDPERIRELGFQHTEVVKLTGFDKMYFYSRVFPYIVRLYPN